MDACATINDMWGISWNTSYLLGNIYVGMWESAGMGYHVDDAELV